MPGTIAGGKAAAATNLKRDPNFYRKIGAMGGRKSTDGGFAVSRCNCDYTKRTHKKAVCAGSRGGTISKRGKANAN